MNEDENIKIFFIGPTGVGKASLVFAEVFYVHCDDGYFEPPVYNEHTVRRSLLINDHSDCNSYDNERNFDLTLVYDCPEFESVGRERAYRTADILALCFSIGSESGLSELKTQWLPEILHYAPETPMVLIGCKADLRRNPEHETPLTTPEAGVQMAAELGAVAYLECSSIKPMQNMRLVYDTLGKHAVESKRQRSKLPKERPWDPRGSRRYVVPRK